MSPFDRTSLSKSFRRRQTHQRCSAFHCAKAGRSQSRLELLETRRLLSADTPISYQAALLKDVNSDLATFSPYNLTSVGNELYFAANEHNQGELWKSDGTTAGTTMVAQVGGAYSIEYGYKSFVAIGGTLYFFAGGTLWKSDGTTGDTAAVASLPGYHPYGQGITSLDSGFVFVALEPSTGSEALWASDGTPAGTGELHDFGANSSITTLVNDNGTVYFSVSGPNGSAIWKTDGTSSGTVQVGAATYTDMLAGPVVSGKSIFFIASDGTNGTALWQSDGATMNDVASLSQPANVLFSAGSSLFYAHGNRI